MAWYRLFTIYDYDLTVKEILLPLKRCEPYLFWDDLCKCVRIPEMLPANFCEEDETYVRACVEEIDAALEMETRTE